MGLRKWDKTVAQPPTTVLQTYNVPHERGALFCKISKVELASTLNVHSVSCDNSGWINTEQKENGVCETGDAERDKGNVAIAEELEGAGTKVRG